MNITPSGENRPPILEFPEKYDEIVKKLTDRENAAQADLMAKKNAKSPEELKDLAKQSLQQHMNRASSSNAPVPSENAPRPVPNPVIIKDAQTGPVKELKSKLTEEIAKTSSIFQQSLGHTPPTA